MGDEKSELEDSRRAEILALDAKIDSSNLFEILGVAAGASPDEVRAAFREASRKFHPDRFFGKNLGPLGAKVDRIFKKLVEANQTLTDTDKREAYLVANPFVRAAARGYTGSNSAFKPAERTETEEARDAERRARLARHPYLAKATKLNEYVTRARELVARGEFSQAFTQLNQAAQVDAQNAEVKAMLADVRKKADLARAESSYAHAMEALNREDRSLALQALRSAVAANPNHHKAAHKAAQLLEKAGEGKEATSYAQKAVDAEGGGNNVEYRMHLALLLEAAGMKALAKKHFDRAQKLDPNHPEVKKHGKKLWPF
ncbi:MAG: DnaJ domain-containing protein [Archangium sp.]|nr:DnaJ domain-containing protein [Archangium sp.]